MLLQPQPHSTSTSTSVNIELVPVPQPVGGEDEGAVRIRLAMTSSQEEGRNGLQRKPSCARSGSSSSMSLSPPPPSPPITSSQPSQPNGSASDENPLRSSPSQSPHLGKEHSTERSSIPSKMDYLATPFDEVWDKFDISTFGHPPVPGPLSTFDGVMPVGTVAPAQVSDIDTNRDGDPDPDLPSVEGVEPYARIEFQDSTFYMTSYQVVIGRDQRALAIARKEKRRADVNASQLAPGQDPMPPLPRPQWYSKSYVSEQGGMLGPESVDDENDQQPPQFDDEGQRVQESLDMNPQYVNQTLGAAAVDLTRHRVDVDYCARVSIHCPFPNIMDTKGISRRHLKIEFQPVSGVFHAISLHNNGFFCNQEHHEGVGTRIVLRSGDELQIKGVVFQFLIPGCEDGATGGEQMKKQAASCSRNSAADTEMSFEFVSSHNQAFQDTSDEDSPLRDTAVQYSSDDNEDDDEGEAQGVGELEEHAERDGSEENGGRQAESGQIRETVESDPVEQPGPEHGSLPKSPLQTPNVPRPAGIKRGPGRPPKNGYMSKREERLLKKQREEEAKKQQPTESQGEAPEKRKVGRPRKHPRPEDDAEDKPEKRKYKPRKPKNEGDEGSPDGEKTVKEKRREKPKTPPLELKRADYTDEQLQKPNKNYATLIDEVLSPEPDGLTLKQIYKRIQQAYPYYFFAVDTKGWESSVRHNLIGHAAFQKAENDHFWKRDPNVSLDVGKKRKASDVSPDRPATSLYNYSPHYPQQQHLGHSHHQSNQQAPRYNNPGNLPPPYQPNGQGYAVQQAPPNYPTQPGGATNQQHMGPHGHPHPQSTASTQGPSYGAGTTPRPQPGAQQQAVYGSPYGGRPQQHGPQSNPGSGSGAYRPSYPSSTPRPGAAQQQMPQHGLPIAQPVATPAAAGQGRPSAPQLPTNGASPAPAPLQPAVDPPLVPFIQAFTKAVVEKLQGKVEHRREAIAMSVVNGSLGLTEKSTTPEHGEVEKILLGIFEQYTLTYPQHVAKYNAASASSTSAGSASSTSAAPAATASKGLSLDVQVVQVVHRFMSDARGVLDTKVNQQKAEALIMSAVDRVLGFTEKTMVHSDQEHERTEFANAEIQLMNGLRDRIVAIGRAPAGMPLPAVRVNQGQGQQRHVQQLQPQPQARPRFQQAQVAAGVAGGQGARLLQAQNPIQSQTMAGAIGQQQQRSMQPQPQSQTAARVPTGQGQHRPAQAYPQPNPRPQPTSQTSSQPQSHAAAVPLTREGSRPAQIQPRPQAAAGTLANGGQHRPAQAYSQPHPRLQPASQASSQPQPQPQAAAAAAVGQAQQRPAQVQPPSQATAATTLGGSAQQRPAIPAQPQAQPQPQAAVVPGVGEAQQRASPVQPQAIQAAQPQPVSQPAAGVPVNGGQGSTQPQLPAAAAPVNGGQGSAELVSQPAVEPAVSGGKGSAQPALQPAVGAPVRGGQGFTQPQLSPDTARISAAGKEPNLQRPTEPTVQPRAPPQPL